MTEQRTPTKISHPDTQSPNFPPLSHRNFRLSRIKLFIYQIKNPFVFIFYLKYIEIKMETKQ